VLDKYFDLLYDFVKKRKWKILFILLLLTVTALAGLRLLKFSSDIEALLPGDPEISRSMNFLKNSNISNKVIISLALTSSEKDKEALLQAADQLAGSLKPPLFTRVTYGLS
jgi:predicted RND superfamily exporter protein